MNFWNISTEQVTAMKSESQNVRWGQGFRDTDPNGEAKGKQMIFPASKTSLHPSKNEKTPPLLKIKGVLSHQTVTQNKKGLLKQNTSLDDTYKTRFETA